MTRPTSKSDTQRDTKQRDKRLGVQQAIRRPSASSPTASTARTPMDVQNTGAAKRAPAAPLRARVIMNRTAAPAPAQTAPAPARDPYATRHPSRAPFWQRNGARPFGWTSDDEAEWRADPDNCASSEESETDWDSNESDADDEERAAFAAGYMPGSAAWYENSMAQDRVEADRAAGRVGCCWAERDFGACHKLNCQFRHRGEY